MFRTLIAGVAAFGLLIAAAPTAAHAKDDILKGVLIGAALGGTVAAIASAHDRSRQVKRRGHSHYRPAYGYERRAPQGRGHYRDHRRPIVVEKRVYQAPRAHPGLGRGHGGYGRYQAINR